MVQKSVAAEALCGAAACPGVTLALDFVAEFVIAGRATVAPPVAVHILRHLASGVPSPPAPQGRPPGALRPQARRQQRGNSAGHDGPAAAAGAAETLSDAGETPGDAAEERFLGVMAGGGFGGEAAPAPDLAAAALDLATRAGFLRAQARVGASPPLRPFPCQPVLQYVSY